MQIAYRAHSLIDAHLVKDALERAQIPAFIAGEYLTGAVGQLPALDYVHVMVPESAQEAAAPIVKAAEAALAQARDAARTWDGDADPAGALLPAV